MPSHYWILQDLDGDTAAQEGRAFLQLQPAYDAAAAIVGNRSAAPFSDGYLFGPGDGTTRVMLRKIPADMAQHWGIPLPEEARP